MLRSGQIIFELYQLNTLKRGRGNILPKNFNELLKAQWHKGNFVCVGLDSDYLKIPASMRKATIAESIYYFNCQIIDATKKLVCAYKPNIAFYEAHGGDGLFALHQTIGYINLVAPEVPVILDAKRADIDNTNLGYIKAAFDWLNADAITVHPYLGSEALKPFLDLKDKGIIVLCKTSNKGAGEFQDLMVVKSNNHKTPLYQYVAKKISTTWNANGNCALVVGATYPEELKAVRELVGDMPILLPGIGAQGAEIKATVENGQNSKGQGMIINSSRGIIFADDPRAETQKLHNQINLYRSIK